MPRYGCYLLENINVALIGSQGQRSKTDTIQQQHASGKRTEPDATEQRVGQANLASAQTSDPVQVLNSLNETVGPADTYAHHVNSP